jgi:hypothetical protein
VLRFWSQVTRFALLCVILRSFSLDILGTREIFWETQDFVLQNLSTNSNVLSSHKILCTVCGFSCSYHAATSTRCCRYIRRAVRAHMQPSGRLEFLKIESVAVRVAGHEMCSTSAEPDSSAKEFTAWRHAQREPTSRSPQLFPLAALVRNPDLPTYRCWNAT